jgi:PncC family amidohydrolase
VKGIADLDAAAAAGLRSAGWQLAVAESCTGGMLGARITSIAGSSDYFAGGVLAYANHVKIQLLGVPAGLIESRGAVSEEVAAQMAAGIVNLTGSDAGLSVTGVAGPAGSDHKPPGTVFVAINCPAGQEVRKLALEGDRQAVREGAVVEALELLVSHLDHAGALTRPEP